MSLKRIISKAVVLLVVCCHLTSASNLLSSVKVGNYQGAKRLVLITKRKPKFSYFYLDKPARLVIDLKDTVFSDRRKITYPLAKQLGVSVRLGIRQPNTSRLVLDGSFKPVVRSFVRSPDRDHRYYRLIFDLRAQSQAINKATKTVSNKSWAGQARNVVVFIDAGHGGKDPGAMGHYHVQEKDVVLGIAKQLYQLLRRMHGIQVILSRRDDHYLTLRQRLAKARQYKADLFISIHADAYKDKRARGASVYTLSQRGATSEAARWLAAKENYSEIGGVSLDDKSNTLRSMLLDLSQTATTRSSLNLGRTVLHALKAVTRLHKKHVEKAPFVVLKSPDIPSILVETGFISNLREERLLRTKSHQKKLAQALHIGIKRFLMMHPIAGTKMAKNQRLRHVVKRGDTLSGLAVQFGVTVRLIKQTNSLSNSRIRVGQVLLLPKYQA